MNSGAGGFSHATVLLKESVDLLNVRRGGFYVDCTAGGGGHSELILRRLNGSGRLYCFDADPAAIKAAQNRLAKVESGECRVEFINDNFSEMSRYGVDGADGILMDLGVSSHQLDSPERGFSFHEDAPLDMRMAGESGGVSAFDVVNGYSEERLAEILFGYGEEKYARAIARGIARARAVAPVATTGQLAEIVRSNVPLSVRNAKNPCRKTFQAIRIEVNDELNALKRGLESAFDGLAAGGRLAVITFHSIEDRIVKRAFADFTAGCDCPRELPLCVCGKTPRAVHVTRKPVVPSDDEIAENRRARSAKLRVVERLMGFAPENPA